MDGSTIGLSFGVIDGFWIFMDWISSFLVGFLLISYVLYIVLTKTGRSRSSAITLSLICGILGGVIGFFPVLSLIVSTRNLFGSDSLYYLFPITVLVGIIVIMTHLIALHKRANKTPNRGKR
jgi:phosphotransferase system  glucose/maltose/N-acetylglucosamine-specific IIC component